MLQKFVLFMALLLVCCSFKTLNAKSKRREPHLIVENFICLKYNNILRVFECNASATSTLNTYNYNVHMILNQKFDHEFKLRLRLDVFKTNGRNKLRVLDSVLNLCEGVNPILKNIALQPIIKELRRSSNFPRTCPVDKNVLYNVDNFVASTALFRSNSPPLNFSVSLDFIDKGGVYAMMTSVGSFWQN